MEEIRLSVDDLRKYEFCEGLSDKQVEEIADFLAEYSIIVFKALSDGEQGCRG